MRPREHADPMPNRTGPLHVLLACALLVAAPLAAQEAPASRPIAAGQTVADSLPPGGTHAFVLELPSDRFVYAEIEQHSVDVRVTIRGPEGEIVHRANAGAGGAERIHFDAEAPGRYTIELQPAPEATGSYALHLRRVEPIATDPGERVDQVMLPFMGDTPGGVVAVVRDGRLAFARAYGAANLAHGVPFRTETRTNIGSTSKQFTAFAIKLLEQQGRLSLDDDVRTHIPELPDLGATVTLRHLLTHTSGYREFLNTLAIGGRRMNEGDYIDRSEIIRIVQRQPELQNQPGAEWNYNNTAYALLAMVVERVTETPFAEWMSANVFEPLGMERTLVRADRAQVVEGSAQGYAPVPEGGFREAFDLPGAMGAGGMYTTVADLARWISNLETGELGGRAVIDDMTTPYVLTDGDTTDYGLGLMLDEFRGLRRIQHGGADIAHRSSFMYFPERRTGIIVLSNNAAFPGTVATAVTEAFLDDALRDEPEEVAVAERPFDPELYDPASFDEFVGRYSLDPMPSFILSFFREGDTLYTQATGQPRIPIEPTSDSTFTLVGVPASVTFHRDEDGAVTHLTLVQNGVHRATRLQGEEWSPDAEALAAYTGRYFSEELETFYDLSVDDGRLVIRHRRYEEQLPLEPGPDEDTFTAGFPLAEVEFERNEAGEVTALLASNGRARGIRFERVRE